MEYKIQGWIPLPLLLTENQWWNLRQSQHFLVTRRDSLSSKMIGLYERRCLYNTRTCQGPNSSQWAGMTSSGRCVDLSTRQWTEENPRGQGIPNCKEAISVISLTCLVQGNIKMRDWILLNKEFLRWRVRFLTKTTPMIIRRRGIDLRLQAKYTSKSGRKIISSMRQWDQVIMRLCICPQVNKFYKRKPRLRLVSLVWIVACTIWHLVTSQVQELMVLILLSLLKFFKKNQSQETIKRETYNTPFY